MARTDKRGRDLKQFLQAEICFQDITFDELREACGVTAARYYRRGDTCGRADADDFPNAEELRHVADFYQLGDDGWLNLLVEFDWLDARDDAPGFTHANRHFGSLGATATLPRTATTPKKTKSRRDHQRAVAADRPPL